MSPIARARKSKDNWKTKAIDRGQDARYQRKENLRIKKERDRYKKEARKAKKQLEKELQKNKSLTVRNKVDIVYLALTLFLVARISFRAVSRVLKSIADYLGVTKTPCTQTIINWVTRLSIVRIQNYDHPVQSSDSAGHIFIIDISIALGAGKILAVSALKADHHHLNDAAPDLQNTRCIAVGVAVSWTGETIADFLFKVIEGFGRPVAFLKDGGKDLSKAVRLLGERGYVIPCIDDMSHVIANLLKHEYGSHPSFDIFISVCGKVSKALKQTVLACLAPPKTSTKARFMNLHRLIVWADKLLKQSPKGRAVKGSLLEKLRRSMDQLPSCKSFIRKFLRDAIPLLNCQKILKTKGLDNNTAMECESEIKAIPPSSPVRIGFINWMKKQLDTANETNMIANGLPISSDPIESLFGIAKVHGTGEVKDAYCIATRLPAVCGRITMEDARNVLNVSVKQQQQFIGDISSLTSQRRKILSNPGCLDSVLSGNSDQKLEMIPGAKNRPKNSENDIISVGLSKSNGPEIRKENIIVSRPNSHLSGLAAAS